MLFAGIPISGKIIRTPVVIVAFCLISLSGFSQHTHDQPDLPDPLIMEAYNRAASQNILAAVNPNVFYGYFSVCADGKGFGVGNTYPSLDGHQMTEALLWLGQVDVVKANWAYVKTFQKPDGQLPLAILPAEAGKTIGPKNFQAPVDSNGGLYRHWVPGDPLRALAGTTYVQNAEVIFRFTGDLDWLRRELPSINLTADFLASLVSDEGAVKGAGYYVERPTRVEYDGVSQCHAADAFHRIAKLNAVVGNRKEARNYMKLSSRIENFFRSHFWTGIHFAEYIHPVRGVISNHGLTDVDWSSIAYKMANKEQKAILWQELKNEDRFYYAGMPTGISTLPMTYEKWESTYEDVMDLAAMGRVWYIEAMARAEMHDGKGLLETIQRVCKMGRENGYYWRERYNEKGGYGAEKYCEYPANLIRIIQRFLLGVEYGTDGTLYLGPTVPDEYWKAGFGQLLSWQGRTIQYNMSADGIKGDYTGPAPQQLSVRLLMPSDKKTIHATINGITAKSVLKDGWITLHLPASNDETPCKFKIRNL
jgi:hypothetical protein